MKKLLRFFRPLILIATGLAQYSPAHAEPWPQSSPEDQGLDSSFFQAMEASVQSGDHANLNSVVIIRNGHLVHESYFRGYGADMVVPVHSVTKSVGATLMAMAEYQGWLDLDAKLLDQFPQYAQISDPLNPNPLPLIQNINNNKRNIRVEHLLTMRSGLAWDEWSVPYATPGNQLSAMITSSSDWSKHILDLPAPIAPDGEFTYNTGLSHLMSGILFSNTQMDGGVFAISQLFPALGIDDYHFEQSAGPASSGIGIVYSPEGFFPMGNGLWLKPRDMARLGQLYLNNGVWNGQRLFADDWRARAWTRHSDHLSDPDIFTFDGSGYGYQWWISRLSYEAGVPIYYANGWGHQFIVVIPDYDMVYVQTADDYNGEPSQAGNILRNFVLPAVMDEEFSIDFTLTGSWYNPDTTGQGFLLEVLPDGEQLLAYWFTYDEAISTKFGGSGQRWFTAIGPYEGNRATLQVAQTTGGVFDDPQAVSSEIIGTLEIEFSGCREATASYALESLDLYGEIPLSRLSPATFCEMQSQ